MDLLKPFRSSAKDSSKREKRFENTKVREKNTATNNKKSIDTKPKRMQPVKPYYQINFRPPLVGQLKTQHEELGELITDIEKLADLRDFDGVNDLLEDFDSKFTSHVLYEIQFLYSYIKYHFENEQEWESSQPRRMKKSMSKIAEKVSDFINRYSPVNEGNIEKFITEFAFVKRKLSTRIKIEEETLYPIYESYAPIVKKIQN